MTKVYFTYGSSETMPFEGGWTLVEAPNKDIAIEAFKIIHPSVNGFINCAFIYSETEFNSTSMCTNGNMGHFCWETITLDVHTQCEV